MPYQAFLSYSYAAGAKLSTAQIYLPDWRARALFLALRTCRRLQHNNVAMPSTRSAGDS
jgi:hypothetical protein